MITIEDARLAKEKLSFLLRSDNVTGIGIGKCDLIPCVVVMLCEPIAERPYAFIDGVRVIYEVVGDVVAQ